MFFAPISASVVRRSLCAEHAQQHRCRLILMLSMLPCQPHRSSHRSSLLGSASGTLPHSSLQRSNEASECAAHLTGGVAHHRGTFCGIIPLSARMHHSCLSRSITSSGSIVSACPMPDHPNSPSEPDFIDSDVPGSPRGKRQEENCLIGDIYDSSDDRTRFGSADGIDPAQRSSCYLPRPSP